MNVIYPLRICQSVKDFRHVHEQLTRTLRLTEIDQKYKSGFNMSFEDRAEQRIFLCRATHVTDGN